MARLAVSTVVIFVAALYSSSNAELSWWTNYGTDLSITAYDAVCWYEFYKAYPDGDKKEDVQCGGQAKSVKDQIPKDDDGAKQYFGPWLKDLAMPEIPAEYQDTCGKYLADPDMKESSDESDALNDPNSKSAFVYKGFAYCLMSTLRKRNGDKAIDAVKDERTHTIKDWRMMALDKDNELRARHGVDPFKRLKALDEAAQNWADQMAKECKMYHSKGDQPIRRYNGEYTGESIAYGGGSYDKLTIPYSSTKMWYREVQYYPFPKSCDEVKCGPKPAVGHFTQTVWAGSKYVGYGMAYSEKCQKWYFAGRYYPGGNVGGQYKANVFPPK